MRSCLSVEELAAYAGGVHTVPIDIAPHIDSCEACRQAIAVAVRGARSSGATPTIRLGRGTQPPQARGADDYAELVTVDPQHYVIGEELSRGGMGRILVARDRRIGRPVAIKELLIDSDDMRARFEREARITARLQHPAIVSLLEAGAWPTGEPFYVMKLVAGESLDRAISRRNTLELRIALLSNVVGVVEALAYAHDKRVIHRDLKPGNVLVGEFGETVVIDWGLAKDLADCAGPDIAMGPYRTASAVGQTVDGSVIGTPAYMPPEQARGEAVDERADVYSLGAMLYHLLCGEPPYTGRTIESIIFAVTEGPPQPLSERTPGVPPDLVAIVAKAMAHAAADRYPTAKEMAVDLKKFQTGQLVGAHRYSAWQLVRRWIRRHRAAVSVAALAFAVVTALGVVSLHRIFEEQARTEHQSKLAETSRGEAEDLMGFMLTDLRDKLEPLGRVKLLDDVARKAVAYYDRKQSNLSPSEMEKLWLARRNLAKVLNEQGDNTAALREYRASLGVAATLASLDPTNVAWQRDLAAAHTAVGAMLLSQGDAAGALVENRVALAIVQSQVTADPASETLQSDLAARHDALAKVLTAQGDSAAALAELRACLAIRKRLAELHPTDDTAQLELETAYNGLGDGLPDEDAKQLDAFHAALAIAQTYAAKDPTNAEWQRDLAACYARIGDALLVNRRDPKGALEAGRALLAISTTLAANDPTNAARQRDLAISHSHLADALIAVDPKNGPKQALVEFRTSAAIFERLAAGDPTWSEWAGYLMTLRQRIGDLLSPHDGAGALKEYQSLTDLAAAAVKRDPTNVEWQSSLAIGHVRLGNMAFQRGNTATALREYTDSLEIRGALSAKDPTNADLKRDVSVSYNKVGNALYQKSDFTGAVENYNAALALALEVSKNIPDALQDVADDRFNLAEAQAALKSPEARGNYEAALVIATKLAAADPDNADLRDFVADIHKKLHALR